jgi:polyisoprenoid-binding protein YceI
MMEPQKAGGRARSFWIIEPRYTTVQFSIKNLFFFTVQGRFTDFAGKIELDENDLKRSSAEATIKAASISTGKKRRDDHLRSPAFLDVLKHPDIRFQSTSVEKGRDRDALRVSGVLTIKEKSKELMIDVIETDHSRSPQGEEVAYYVAQAKIDRFDYGIKYGPLLIGRILKVTIQVQATKQT